MAPRSVIAQHDALRYLETLRAEGEHRGE